MINQKSTSQPQFNQPSWNVKVKNGWNLVDRWLIFGWIWLTSWYLVDHCYKINDFSTKYQCWYLVEKLICAHRAMYLLWQERGDPKPQILLKSINPLSVTLYHQSHDHSFQPSLINVRADFMLSFASFVYLPWDIIVKSNDGDDKDLMSPKETCSQKIKISHFSFQSYAQIHIVDIMHWN